MMTDKKNDIPIVSHLEQFSSGITDGITISLALAAGLYFAGFENGTVSLACLVTSIAVAIVMAAGVYFSRRDQMHDTREHSLKEWQRTRNLLVNLGLSSEQIQLAEQEWLREQSELPETAPTPASSANVVVVLFAFLAGGLLPAACFFISDKNGEGFRVSLIVSGIAFAAFGYIRDKANGLNPWWGSVRALMIGAAAVLVSMALANVFFKL